MDRAQDTARYFLMLAGEEVEPEFLTHMRLQKLLYYAQGWSLAVRHRPLFSCVIEAWRYGPVVRSVYPCFADYGDGPIPFREARVSPSLREDDRRMIAAVWDHYKQYSAIELTRKTHREKPWKQVWGDRDMDARGDDPIPHSSMIEFFTEEYEKLQLPGLELEKLRQAERDIAGGRTIRLEDAMARLRDAV